MNRYMLTAAEAARYDSLDDGAVNGVMADLDARFAKSEARTEVYHPAGFMVKIYNSPTGLTRGELIWIALHKVTEIAEKYLEDLGDCDHANGICYCGMRDEIETAKALMKEG